MDNSGNGVYTKTLTLSAGEYKFLEFKNWDSQYGSDGHSGNAGSWTISDPGEYILSYDVINLKMSATKNSTPLDDPMKIATIPWLEGGCGHLKLTKNGSVYTATYDLTSAVNTGSWGEDAGFVRFAIIACQAKPTGTEPDLGDSWKNVVARYGFTEKEDGYATLDTADYVEVGKAITLKSMPGKGQNIVKGLSIGKKYLITIDFTDSSSPTLKVTETN